MSNQESGNCTSIYACTVKTLSLGKSEVLLPASRCGVRLEINERMKLTCHLWVSKMCCRAVKIQCNLFWYETSYIIEHSTDNVRSHGQILVVPKCKINLKNSFPVNKSIWDSLGLSVTHDSKS
jgi:hypothetical protein